MIPCLPCLVENRQWRLIEQFNGATQKKTLDLNQKKRSDFGWFGVPGMSSPILGILHMDVGQNGRPRGPQMLV
jgi:hypothetical protein